MNGADFPRLLALFFTERLMRQRQASPHMPLPAVTRQSRRLDREHQPDPALAYSLEKRIKAGAVNTGAGNPQIVIDDLDIPEAELFRMVGQRVLETLTLDVVLDLELRRLPDIDVGGALEVGRGQRRGATHRYLRRSRPDRHCASPSQSAPPGC